MLKETTRLVPTQSLVVLSSIIFIWIVFLVLRIPRLFLLFSTRSPSRIITDIILNKSEYSGYFSLVRVVEFCQLKIPRKSRRSKLFSVAVLDGVCDCCNWLFMLLPPFTHIVQIIEH
jgi:hypothetical protein